MTTTAPLEAASDDGFEVVRRRRITAEPLGYVAPLDGLRAVAVLGVLLYHARFTWMPGGYLGVSTFFTLSGFLITSLLLREWNRDSSIDLRGFWVRRFRRLLPASWLTMGIIVLLGASGAWSSEQMRHLRGDLPFALLEVANWHFIAGDRSYGDAFSAPSPLEHFWSLAVEQQFYVLLPVLVLGVLSIGGTRPARHRVATLVAVLVGLTALSAALNGLLADDSIDRAYFGTDTRMAELLIGGLLACVTLRRLRLPTGWLRHLTVAAGVAGLVATFWLWHSAPLHSRWMYPWGLLVTALCTAAVILGAVQEGPLGRLLAVAPLRWLGRVSYGVYLLHWPVFLWLSPARVGWSQWPLFGLRMAVTLAAAALMFRFVEDPVRRGGRLEGRRAALVAVGAAAALLAGNLVVTRDAPGPGSLSEASSMPPADASTTTAPPPPLRTIVVGDRIAASFGDALSRMDDGFDAISATSAECGLALGGWVALPDDTAERDSDRCRGEHERMVAEAVEFGPEVILVQGAMRDVTDRRLDKGHPWAGPGDPAVDDFLATDIGGLVDELSSAGAEVVLVAMPQVRNTVVPHHVAPPPAGDPAREALQATERAELTAGVPAAGFRENDPARVARYNEVLASVARSRGIRFLNPTVVMRDWDGGQLDPARRPDGVGFSEEAAGELAEWFLPQLRTRVEAAPAADAAAVIDPDAPLPPPPPPMERRHVPAGARADVLVVGDSVGFNVAFGLARWAESAGGLRVENAARLGCPVARGGGYRFKEDLVQFDAQCDWAQFFPDRINGVRPEVVVLSSGIWEVVDRRLPGDDRFRSVGEPGVDRYLLKEFLSAIDVLGADGATVVVLTQPHIESGLNQGFTGLPESEPARIDRVNELWGQAVSMRPGVAVLVDFRSWVASLPGGEIDPAIRPDGIHFTDEFAPTIGEWLGPQLGAIARGDVG